MTLKTSTDSVLARNVRCRREQLGIEQKELARKVGVTPAAICKIEKGLSKPRYELLAKITAVLDCTADELMKGAS